MFKLIAVGHLGKDCVVNTVNGKSVLNFNIAHTKKFKNAQGVQQDKTTWLECSWWNDRTAIAPYLKKGTQVLIEGEPSLRTYPKNDGTTGASIAVNIVAVTLLGNANNSGNGNNNVSAPAQNNMGGGYQPITNNNNTGSDGQEPIDDLPF